MLFTVVLKRLWPGAIGPIVNQETAIATASEMIRLIF